MTWNFFLMQDLIGHQRKVGALAWHPTAENVLASGGADAVIFVWNTETGEPMFALEDLHPDLIYCLAWNYNGSLLVSTCKDKLVRVIDPRKGALISVSNNNNNILMLLYIINFLSLSLPLIHVGRPVSYRDQAHTSHFCRDLQFCYYLRF